MRLGGVGKRAARRAAAGFLPAIVAAFLRRCCLNAQPCVSLRRPRRARGIAISGSALCAFAPSVPCGCTAAALQSRCARPTRALLGFSFTPRNAAAPLRGWRRRGAAFWCRAPPCCKWLGCCSAFCRCVAAFAATSLRRCRRREPPCGSLRRPRRDRGIASSPYSLLGFSSHPFVPPPLRYGVGGGGAVRSYAALRRWGKGFGG